MSSDLLIAIVAITLALVLYTIGVWWERLSGELTNQHVLIFWAGLACDTYGTHAMSQLAGATTLTLHAATGSLALFLMAAHALWAIYTVSRGDAAAKKRFHRYSLIVWLIWLIPYGTGLVMGMAH